MSGTSLDQSGGAQTLISSVATIGAVMVFGFVLAYWTWQWIAPRPEARAPAANVADDEGRARGLFGVTQQDGATVLLTGIPIKLLGVAAASDQRSGHAVMQLEPGKTVAVREGEDVAPGIRLAEVHADHVVLVRNGAREVLAWPQDKSGK